MAARTCFKYRMSMLLFGVGGCARKSPPVTTPYALLPTIMGDNVLYYNTDKEMAVDLDEADYLGRIASVVSISKLPVDNGQVNIPYLNAPYAGVPEGIVVLMDGKWSCLKLGMRVRQARQDSDLKNGDEPPKNFSAIRTSAVFCGRLHVFIRPDSPQWHLF